MGDRIVLPGEGDDYLELAARPGVKPKGRLFRKQILHFGSFEHPKLPGHKVVVDKKFAEQMITNFSNGVCDIVQAPLVDDKNRHSEDPLRNIGAVVDLDYDDKGIYAYLDARKHADDLGKTLLGASGMISLNYTDTKTGEKVGPTLLHMAVTNRPYITNLDDYQEVIRASADTSDETTVLLGAVTDEENMPMTKEEMIAALKAEYGIDVEALQASAVEAADLAALSNVLGEESLTISDVAEAVLELAQKNESQETQIAELVEANEAMRVAAATKEVDGLVEAGRILPKQRDKMLELSMNDRETFEALLPDESIVSLSEDGVTTHQSTQSKSTDDEIARLAALANGTKTE